MSSESDQTDAPFEAMISHLNKEEQAEYEEAYEKHGAIQKKPVSQKSTGKSWKFYKALKIKEDALYYYWCILKILALRSWDRIDGKLPVPTTTKPAAAEHKAAEEAKKATKEAHKAVHAAPIAIVKADEDYDADDEMD